jgi:transposase
MERVPHQPGRKPRVGAEDRQLVVGWVAAQPDLTLSDIQAKLQAEAGITLGIPRIWRLLRKLKLRLKKSRSTLRNGTRKPTGKSANGS